MTRDQEIILTLDLQLSDREMFLIGMIVAHWGTLEHEVFTQTLLSFDDADNQAANLPKAMNNIQFTQVLALWKERVVDKSKGKRATVLRKVYDELLAMKEPRDALVHGMWQWSPENPDRISTIRVKKRKVLTSHFNVEYLQEFALRLSQLNFQIHYPRGTIDLAASRQQAGFYISRKGLQLMADMAKFRRGSGKSADA
ncbi:hypothetical protein DYQ93_20245 [Xanthomonas sp. LMG 8992]|uniref:hypothetical protein n=1 Tax=Xanthomonas sp. LMG 8992 TaxID=1591157 RepID=UPI001368790B|nr:hypothetical protein [Xanthomonas sp. LMG 8992]MXV13339.1 hypothetical protein [Xanthomonas sp. LMG 8992]